MLSAGLFAVNSANFLLNVFAQPSSPDAIAVRIIPNPEHYSPLLWYGNQGFTGSPQSFLVDSYDAIRDGNTVYVNAANVDGGVLYTNIYLISLNEKSENASKEIFTQIVANWKFNTNLTEPGKCGISEVVCMVDSDCQQGVFCDSHKAKVVRDTKRLSNLAEMKRILEVYRQKNNRYPILPAGTYLPHTSLSVWPSWQKALALELGQTLPLDPLNKLGACGEDRFNPITCWDEKAKEFAKTLPALPDNSNVFLYIIDSKGIQYNLCGIMESGYIQGASNGACDGSMVFEYSDVNNNHQPRIIDGYSQTGTTGNVNLPIGYSGHEYTGQIRAEDLDGDLLSWKIDATITNWSGWSEPLVQIETETPSLLKLWAATAGNPGVYSIKITVDDGRGEQNSTFSQIYNFTIVNYPPQFNAYNIEYTASTTNPLIYSFIVKDDPSNYPLTVSAISEPITGITSNFVPAGAEYVFSLGGIIATSFKIPEKTSYDYIYNFSDNFNSSDSAKFTVTVNNTKPVINPFSCVKVMRVNDAFSCKISASDVDGHAIEKFTFNINPASGWLSINNDNNSNNFGLISGTAGLLQVGLNAITVTAIDEYGAESMPTTINVIVNNFCGDGKRQVQNTEGRGGPSNDGKEDCEGSDNVAAEPYNSSPNKQYRCTTPPECPTTGDCSNTCAYTGGWCGDGIINTYGQDNKQEECDPNLDDIQQICAILRDAGIKDLDGSVLDCTLVNGKLPNLWADSDLKYVYGTTCMPEYCTIGCVGKEDLDKIGTGCYLDLNGNKFVDTAECQKGKYVCRYDEVVCYDVFTDPNYSYDYSLSGQKKIFDECCLYNLNNGVYEVNFFSINKIFPGTDYSCIVDNCDGKRDPSSGTADGKLNYLQGTNTTLGFEDLFGTGPMLDDLGKYITHSGYEYNCDEVCKMRNNSVCVGVGLTTENCISIRCDAGASCLSQATNLSKKDCKTNFIYSGTHSCLDEPHVFPVKSTACYCLAP